MRPAVSRAGDGGDRGGRAARMLGAFVIAVASIAALPAAAADVRAAPSPAAAAPAPGALFDGAPRVDGRYRNLSPFTLPTLGGLVDWYWHWLLSGGTAPPPGGYDAIPVDTPDLGYLRANRADTTATWVGHSTVLLQLGGLNVITDPQFSQRASPFSFLGPARKVRVPFAIADGPHIDVVLISHNHYDHLDADSVDALARQPGGSPLFLVPLGVERWFHARGIDRVIGLDWWNAREVAPTVPGVTDRLRITFVPTQHWSARGPGDRFETLWGGYVVERVRAARPDAPAATAAPVAPTVPAAASAAAGEVDYRFFFGGDTGYGPAFRERIHARFDRFDFAAIPIGAYEPNRYLHAQHVTPGEAVRIHRDLDVTRSLGIHWGTFVLTTEAFDQPPKDLAAALASAGLPADAFVTFRHGQMQVLEKAATR